MKLQSSSRLLLSARSYNFLLFNLAILFLLSVVLINRIDAVRSESNTREDQTNDDATILRTQSSSSLAPTLNNQSSSFIVHEREFVSPQVKVQMDCQRDKTIIRVNFTKPFNGILGAGKLETSKCLLNGNGTKLYELQVAHNASQCDTQWDSSNNSISNTLFIRFHSSLETGSDIAKNVMCRLTVGDLVVGRRPLNKNKSQSQMDKPIRLQSTRPRR